MKRSWFNGIGIASVLFAGTVCAAPTTTPVHTLAQVPAGLMAAVAKTAAKEAATNPAYAIDAHGCAQLPADHGTSLASCFTKQGPRFRTGHQHLALRLSAWGRAGDAHPVHLKRSVPHANRIAYQGHGIQEWWRVLPMGYEQGFTLSKAPAGKGKVVLQLQASAAPTLDQGTLAWGNLRYGKLQVIDAAGHSLPASLTARGRSIELAFDASNAHYPVTVDPTVWTQQEMTASDGVAVDMFGISVALSADGSSALVGADYHQVGGNSDQGAAYIYTYTAATGTWSQVAELTASNGAANDYFGLAVAFSPDGSTALIGADGNQGAAYVFTKPASGWTTTSTYTAELTASSGAYFGSAVALSANGSTALVGAEWQNVNSNSSQGAAYVYSKPASGGWATTSSYAAELTASDGAAYDHFGHSVALSADGGTALVGAYDKTINSNSGQGAAYLYTYAAATGAWNQAAELTASDGAANDDFGHSVALSADGGTALVGAYLHPVNSNAYQGTAYIYAEPASGGWATTSTYTAELTASDGVASDKFGSAVALSADGSTALVGAFNANGGTGTAYLYTEPASGGWATTATYAAKLTASNGWADDFFGGAVALSADGGMALVSAVNAPYDSSTYTSGPGAAYLLINPNLSTTLTVPSSATISSSYTVDYIVTNNDATNSSANLTVTLPVPSGASYSSSSATQGSCSYDSTSSTVSCDLGRIAASASSATAELVLTAPATAGTLTQSASVYGSPSLAQSATTTVPAVPTVSGTNVTVAGGSSGSASLTLTGTGTLSVTATSSDTTLLPNANITGASACTAAGNCTLTLTPAAGQSGTATVTVQLADSYGQTATGTFTATVSATTSNSSGGNSGSSSGGGGTVSLWTLLLLGGLGCARRRQRR